MSNYVLWSFGSGTEGHRDTELSGPHMAEENPFDPDEIIIAEENGCDVLIVNRHTRRAQLIYGERGVAGTGTRLNRSHSAHFIPAGPFRGNIIITEYMGDHRILIIERDTRKILWSCPDLPLLFDAIYWDDEHLLVSSGSSGIVKLRLHDSAQVWKYTGLLPPFYIHKLIPEKEGFENYGNSFGGDFITSTYGPPWSVREVRISDSATVWEYGGQTSWVGDTETAIREKERARNGDVYDKLFTPDRGFRYGKGFTIMCDESGRVFCVNRRKETIWELDHLLWPTHVSVTTRGTLLVTEWGRNMIREIDPFSIPERKQKDAYLMKDYPTADSYVDSDTMESRGYIHKNIQIHNVHAQASLAWRVLASHDASAWQIIYTPQSHLGAGSHDYTIVSNPWSFLKVQVKSASPGKPARAEIFISMTRR